MPIHFLQHKLLKFLGEGECLQLALKHRCRNALERRWKRERFRSAERFLRKMIRRCEVNFLPQVYPKSGRDPPIKDGISQGYPQHLVCRDDLLDFSLCPELRPMNETSELVCNPIRDNTRRCETTHESVGTRCRMFESCDQAVIISGGWNRQTSRTHHRDNVVKMYHLLRRNGFHQQAVKIFYANGMHRGIQGICCFMLLHVLPNLNLILCSLTTFFSQYPHCQKQIVHSCKH